MPINLSEHRVSLANNPERRTDATVFDAKKGEEYQIDFHASKLDQLRDRALGVAAQQPVATIDSQPVPEKVETLTPQQEVLAFAKQLMTMRYDLLDRTLFAENPHHPSYPIESTKEDFTPVA